MRSTRRKSQPIGSKLVKCKCGKRIRLRYPVAVGLDKTHAVCRKCNISWHYSLDRGIYSHTWKKDGVDVHKL